MGCAEKKGFSAKITGVLRRAARPVGSTARCGYRKSVPPRLPRKRRRGGILLAR